MTGPRVLLMSLSVRTSAKGREYLSGYLGKARIVGFEDGPDKYGNPTWNIFVAEPEPRDGSQPARRPQERETASARASAPASAGTRSASSYRANQPFPQQPGQPVLAAVLEDAAERNRPALRARLRQVSLQQRNELIHQLGRLYFPDGSLRARARALIAAARLYRDGEWRHHRALTAPPDDIAGTARELLWRAFKTHDCFPLGQRTIEDLIR